MLAQYHWLNTKQRFHLLLLLSEYIHQGCKTRAWETTRTTTFILRCLGSVSKGHCRLPNTRPPVLIIRNIALFWR